MKFINLKLPQQRVLFCTLLYLTCQYSYYISKFYVFNEQLFNNSKLKARSMVLSFNARNLFDRKVQHLFAVKVVLLKI